MVSVSLHRCLVLAFGLLATSAGYVQAQGCSSCGRDTDLDLGVALQPVPDPGPIPSSARHHDDWRHDERRHAEIEQASHERWRDDSDESRDDDRNWDYQGRWHQDRMSYSRWNDHLSHDRSWREDRWLNDDDRYEAPAPRYRRTAWSNDRYERRSRYPVTVDVDYEAPVPDPVHLDAPRPNYYRDEDNYSYRDRDDYGWRHDSWRRTASRSDRTYDRYHDSCDTRPYTLHDRWICDDDADFETPSAALVWQTMSSRRY